MHLRTKDPQGGGIFRAPSNLRPKLAVCVLVVRCNENRWDLPKVSRICRSLRIDSATTWLEVMICFFQETGCCQPPSEEGTRAFAGAFPFGPQLLHENCLHVPL